MGWVLNLVEYVKDNENMYGDYIQVKMLTGILTRKLNSFPQYALRNTTKEIFNRYSNIYF